MLTQLRIKNFALIDELTVSFSGGMSCITGETGAGKSILLGGLSLVLGKRADISLLKDLNKKCVIEAVFQIKNYDLKNFFSENNLDYFDETILRREVIPNGKSRAFINDTPVKVNMLENLSMNLIRLTTLFLSYVLLLLKNCFCCFENLSISFLLFISITFKTL